MIPHRPDTFGIEVPEGRPSCYTNHLSRRLSAMRGQFADHDAYTVLLPEGGDVALYDIYELARPSVAGEPPHGLSIVHPGKVGDEYFMTKGHFHAVLETAEVYYCLGSEGMMVMETPEGEWAVVLHLSEDVEIGDGICRCTRRAIARPFRA